MFVHTQNQAFVPTYTFKMKSTEIFINEDPGLYVNPSVTYCQSTGLITHVIQSVVTLEVPEEELKIIIILILCGGKKLSTTSVFHLSVKHNKFFG